METCVRTSCSKPGNAWVKSGGDNLYGPLCNKHAFDLDCFLKGIQYPWCHDDPAFGNPYSHPELQNVLAARPNAVR